MSLSHSISLTRELQEATQSEEERRAYQFIPNSICLELIHPRLNSLAKSNPGFLCKRDIFYRKPGSYAIYSLNDALLVTRQINVYSILYRVTQLMRNNSKVR